MSLSKRLTALLAKKKQLVVVGLYSAAGALTVLGLVIWTIYQAFQGIALHSLTQMESEFVAQTDALSSLMDTMVRNYGLQVFYTPAVSQLREGRNLTEWNQMFNLRELNTYVGSSDFVDSINVYNQETGYIYSTDPKLLSAPIDEFEDKSAAELFRSINSDMLMKPIRRTAFPSVPWREKEFFSFLFFETTPGESSSQYSAIMINIPYNWYVGQLMAFDDESSCVLLNEKGGLIAFRNDTVGRWAMHFRRAVVSAGLEQHESSYLTKVIGNKQVVCYYSRMKSNNWYYLRIQTLEDCLPGLLQLRDNLVAWLAVGVVLLTFVAAVVVMQLYFPFHRIRLVLRQAGDAITPTERQVTQLVHSSLEYHQANILLNLLQGRNIAPETAPEPPFVLLLAEVEHSKGREMILEHCPKAYIHHQSGCILALLPQKQYQNVHALCDAFVAQFHCRCYYSSLKTQLSEISQCYETLLEMQRQRYWHPCQLIWAELDFEPRNEVSHFSDKQATQMISALRSGNLEEGQQLWSELLSNIRNDTYRDQAFAISRTGQLLSKAMAELGLPEQPLVTDEYLDQLQDIEELTLRFDQAFQDIARMGADKRRQRLSDIAAQVAHRIDTSYEDPALSPAVIADEMDMNTAYLGRMFRQSLNMSISDYINHVRVQHAARLLTATALSVESIAAKVGFSNSKYFFVVFKKIYGQTPLQYRKSGGVSMEPPSLDGHSNYK